MSSAKDFGSTSNGTPPFDTSTASHTLTSNTLRNQQAFYSNQQLLSATRASIRQSNIRVPAMNPKAQTFTEPVIASSDRYADIAPYTGRIYNADPQQWGSILPWEFPQDSSKEAEEEFLRAAFGDLECHIQGFRFLKQVWYDIAKWNFEIRVPAIAKQWLDHNKDIWTDPTLVEFVIKPSAELKTFSFAAEEFETYGEKLLGWAVKHIQYLVQLEQYESSTIKAKGSVTDVQSEPVETSVIDTSSARHHHERIAVDSKQPEVSENLEKADVTKSAELAQVLPLVLDTSPKTAPIRPMSSSEQLSDFDSSVHVPPGFQAGGDAMHGPAICNRKRGNSGVSRRFTNYSGGSGRASQKWQQQAPFAGSPFQQPPLRDPNFAHAGTPPVHLQHEMSFLSGGVPGFMPSQQPPPGFQNTAPMSQPGPNLFDNGPSGPQHGFMSGPMLGHGPVSQPPVYQNAYYNSHDPSYSFNDRSNGRDGVRVFSGSNVPWSQHNDDSFGYNKYGGKRRESMSTRGGSGRGRGGSFGRGGKGSRGRNSFSNAGRRDPEMFAGDGTFQYLNSHQHRGAPPASGQCSSDARNAEGNTSLKWRRRRDTSQLENLPPPRDISDGQPPPSTQQPRAAMIGTRQPSSAAAFNEGNVAESGKVSISTIRGESMEVWTSSRIPRDGNLIGDKERLELPIKPIHDPTCQEAQEHPERVLTESFIGGECTHVRKLIMFGVPLTLPLEQLAAYFQDRVGAVDKISRNPMPFMMGSFDTAAHQCWITFASHLDAKKAIEMAQSAMHWFNGILLRIAVPFEYCKEEHRSYPGFEFAHLHKEPFSSFQREGRTRRWSSHYDSRPSTRTSAMNGNAIPAVVPEAHSVEYKGEVSVVPSHQARPMVTGAGASSAISGSSTTTPAPSAGPTPRKNKNKNKNKNKKSKKAKASSEVASVDSAQEAEPDAEPSSNGLDSHTAETVPIELRKALESSTESKFQAAPEPSFSPEIAMKAQLPTIALPPPGHQSTAKAHGPIQGNDFPKVEIQWEPIASTTPEVVIEQPRKDASAGPTSVLVTEPESACASGNTKEGMDNVVAPSVGDEKRTISPNESPKSDVDDSFHTAADSPNDTGKHSRQIRSRGMSNTTDSSTVVALPAAKEVLEDTANSDNRSATASATVAAGEVVAAISPASATTDKDIHEEPPVSEARSTNIEQPEQVKPVSVDVSEPAQGIQRSASTLPAVPPAPGFVTSPATPALASGAVTPSEPSSTAPSQPPKKDGKPKGPSQTESFSLYSKKNAPKPLKQKPKKGGSRAVSSNADIESNASRVVSHVSTPDVRQEVRHNDRAPPPNSASLANVNALAKQADSGALPNTVSSSSNLNLSNLTSGAKQTTQQEAVATSSDVAQIEPASPQDQTSSMTLKSLSGVSSAFRSPTSSDASAQPDRTGTVQGAQSAAEINSEDSCSSRPNTTAPSTGADAVDGPPFHPLPEFRGGDEPRDSGHSGGQHDVPSHDTEHSVVGLGICSAAGQSLNPANEAKSKAKKKKAKKRKDDGKGTDDDSAEETGLSVITDKSNSISTSQPSPFAFQFTSNSPVKLSEHDDIGHISHTRSFGQFDSQPQPQEDHSDQSSQALDGPTAQASREPTPSSTAASEPSPMKKRIELLQGRRSSRLVVEAPPVKRPASAASKHARRQGSIASAKSSESLASAGPEKFLYLYQSKAPSSTMEEIEGGEEDDSEEAWQLDAEGYEEYGTARELPL